jgi:hypothetical protein
LIPPTVDEVLSDCPTPQEINEVDSRIKIIFESDPSSSRMVCRAENGSANLTRLQKNTYNAILLMKKLAFDAPLPWISQSLYDWFTTTITGIRFRSDFTGHTCCGTPPVIKMNTELHVLYSDRWTAVGKLAGIFIHEARHTYMAHECNGRDTAIADMGAFGVEYSFYRWLAYHSDPEFLTSLNPGSMDDYRQAARFEAFAMQRSSFCNEPTPDQLPPALTGSLSEETVFSTAKIESTLASNVPVPLLLSPGPDESVAMKSVVFTWEPVDFTDPVTYNIEVDAYFQFDKDWHFWIAHTDEHGLVSPKYTLTLPFDYYCKQGRWRVWATGLISGDGPKSDWRTFRIESK